MTEDGEPEPQQASRHSLPAEAGSHEIGIGMCGFPLQPEGAWSGGRQQAGAAGPAGR